MAKYNHMLTINFTVNSDKEDASDVTNEMLIEALGIRITLLRGNKHESILEACGGVEDTIEN